jgi:hypothetical protein
MKLSTTDSTLTILHCWSHILQDSIHSYRFLNILSNSSCAILNITLPTVVYWCDLVSDIKGRTQTEGVWLQGAEGNIWTEEGWNNRRSENTALTIIICTDPHIKLQWLTQGRWMGTACSMHGDAECQEERYYWEDLHVRGRMLNRNRMVWCGLDSSGSGYGPVACSCTHRNEPRVP